MINLRTEYPENGNAPCPYCGFTERIKVSGVQRCVSCSRDVDRRVAIVDRRRPQVSQFYTVSAPRLIERRQGERRSRGGTS